MTEKRKFTESLRQFSETLPAFVASNGGQWSIKGFIDSRKNIYTLSSDTKIISKIFEIQLFPLFRKFADSIGYDIILAEEQNWYPDMSFVKRSNKRVKFAVDIKTTYRTDKAGSLCNGFTLGSHGTYFRDRNSTKNIQFPYKDYAAHITFGIIYTRINPASIDDTEVHGIDKLESVTSVIGDIVFFVQEKWKIASDTRGSGNTANMGSIKNIDRLIDGNGVFIKLGEKIFDEYWTNYGTLQVPNPKDPRENKGLSKLEELLDFKGISRSKINKPGRK